MSGEELRFEDQYTYSDYYDEEEESEEFTDEELYADEDSIMDQDITVEYGLRGNHSEVISEKYRFTKYFKNFTFSNYFLQFDDVQFEQHTHFRRRS